MLARILASSGPALTLPPTQVGLMRKGLCGCWALRRVPSHPLQLPQARLKNRVVPVRSFRTQGSEWQPRLQLEEEALPCTLEQILPSDRQPHSLTAWKSWEPRVAASGRGSCLGLASVMFL